MNMDNNFQFVRKTTYRAKVQYELVFQKVYLNDIERNKGLCIWRILNLQTSHVWRVYSDCLRMYRHKCRFVSRLAIQTRITHV